MTEIAAATQPRPRLSIDSSDECSVDRVVMSTCDGNPLPAALWEITSRSTAAGIESASGQLDHSLPNKRLSASMPVGPRPAASLTPSSHALQQYNAVTAAAAGDEPQSPAATAAVTSPASPLPHSHGLALRSSTVLSAAPMHVSLLKERHRRTASPDLRTTAPITITTDDCSALPSPTASNLSPRSSEQSPTSASSSTTSTAATSSSASTRRGSNGAASRTLPPLDSLSPSQSSALARNSQSISGSFSKQPRDSHSINPLSALRSMRYSILSPNSGQRSPTTPTSTASTTAPSPINQSHLHVSVPGEIDSVRGKRSSRSVTQWLRNGAVSASPSASQPINELAAFVSGQPLATPSSAPAFPALQGAAALALASPMGSSTPTRATVRRSASFYHFKTPKAKRQADPGTFRNPLSTSSDRSQMPSLLLPNTRAHIRSASLMRAITSPMLAQRSLSPQKGRGTVTGEAVQEGQVEEAIVAEDDDGDDPISDYHRYICAEAEAYKEHTRLARMQRLKARRRSSVLPVPVFSAHGELEKSYIQAQHDKRRKLVMKAMKLLPLVHTVYQLPLAAANAPFLYTTSLPITAVAVIVLVVHTVLLHLDPAIGSTDRSLDIGLFVTTTLTTLCSVVVLLLGNSEGVWWSNTDAPLMFVIFLYLYSMCILRLGFRLCLLQSALVFTVYTALDFSRSANSLHWLVVSLFFHLASLLTLLFFSHQRESHQEADVLQQQFLNNERVKADKLLHSMLPARILQEYLDGRVGHVSAVATIGFVIVELGVMQRRRFHSKSSMDEDELGGWGARNSFTGSPGSAPSPSVGQISPTEMIKRLHDTFKRIDAVVSMYANRGVCKIETVSKTYMLCSGLLSDTDDHAAAMLDVCLEINNMIVSRQSSGPRLPIALRIGVATGPVVGGIIGRNRKFFRLFGDTVNVSARMSTTAKVGEMMLTESTYQALDERQRDMYTIDAPRRLLIKGKGEMAVYKLSGAREEWKPTFSKAVMARGHHGHDDGMQTSLLQRHSFVYHNLLLMTKLHPLHLGYRTPDTSIEPCFQHEYALLMSRHRLKAHSGLLLLCLLILGLCIWQGSEDVLVMLGVVIALVIVHSLMSFTRVYARHFQPILVALVFCMLAWAVVLEGVTTTRSTLSPLLSMQFIIIVVSLLPHLQFRFLLPLTSTAFVAFTITSLVAEDATVRILPPLASLLGTVLASLSVAWSWERRQRRNFLLAYAMEREQQQMDHFLSNLLPKFVLDVLKHKSTSNKPQQPPQQSTPSRQQQQPQEQQVRRSVVTTPVAGATTPNKGSAESSPSESPTSGIHPQASLSTQPSTSRSIHTPSATAATRATVSLSTLDSAISSRFAMRFARATVFESDIEGYTNLVSSWTATQVLSVLNRVFSRFDALARRCGVEKIETIGDAFIVVVFDGRSDPVLDFALSVQRGMAELNEENARKASTREPSMVRAAGRLSWTEGETVRAAAANEDSNAAQPHETSVVTADRMRSVTSRPTSQELTRGAAAEATSERTNGSEPVVALSDKPTEMATSFRPRQLALSPVTSGSPRSASRSVRPAMAPLLLPPHTVSSALSSPLTSARPPPFQLHLRMGVSTGPAVGGIVGNEVPRFALFGQAMDGAIALEQAGKTDEVAVSKTTYEDAKDRYEFELSETIAADGQPTYRLMGKKDRAMPKEVEADKAE